MLKALNCKCEIVKNFSPAWFASVMGTGVLAITTMFYSGFIPILKEVAKWLFYLNVGLFFILLIPWTLRWLLFKNEALKDLNHPIISNFYATIAIGMLVLAADFIIIGKNLFIGKIFWFIGAFLTLFFGIVTPFMMFKGEHVKIEHINPCLLYTSPSPRDGLLSRMPSSA
jgi:tellurite resistance protein TehA-like permease